MSKSTPLKTLVTALGVAFATSLASVPIANAQANPFGRTAQPGYRVAADTTAPAPAAADTAKGNAMQDGMTRASTMNTTPDHWCANKANAGQDCGIKMLDNNSDGKVTKEEFIDGHEKMFANMDANHDGVLGDNEIGPMMGGMHGKGKYCPRKDQPTK